VRSEVRFGGLELLGKPSYRIAQPVVALVPQGPGLFVSLSVDEHLRIVPGKGNGGWSAKRIYEMFPRRAERKKVGATQLSGGDQQILAIGRALLQRRFLGVETSER